MTSLSSGQMKKKSQSKWNTPSPWAKELLAANRPHSRLFDTAHDALMWCCGFIPFLNVYAGNACQKPTNEMVFYTTAENIVQQAHLGVSPPLRPLHAFPHYATACTSSLSSDRCVVVVLWRIECRLSLPRPYKTTTYSCDSGYLSARRSPRRGGGEGRCG